MRNRGLPILIGFVLVLWSSFLYAASPTVTVSLFHGKKLLSTVDAEVVSTPEKRALGLMFRKSLDNGKGMLFIFDKETNHPFWMKNTFISLDILFVDHLKRIVWIASETEPLSTKQIYSKGSYRYVLEVPAGYAKNHGIVVGDHLTWK